MRAERYTVVAIILHWAIAAAIAFNILLGWWMHEALEDSATASAAITGYQVHKSVGLTVLLLSLARLGWRLMHAPPALPDKMAGWEKFIAKATHWIFYALMIAIPFSGWLYVSAGWSHENDRPLSVPTLFFGLFQVPHLFGLEHAANETRAGVADTAIETHELLVWAMIGLVALHVGAALKHWLIDRDAILSHMIPGAPTLGPEKPAPVTDPRRRLGLIVGFALIALAGVGLAAALQAPSPSAPAVAAPESHEHGGDDEVEHGEDHSALPTPPPAAAGASDRWAVTRSQSSIRFSGVHAGTPFTGSFSRWRADIRFDPANLDASSATVTIETASASDGIALHDQSLPQAEWFDTANHPTAVFRTERIRHRDGNAYEARGTLTIKGKPIRVDLPFTLTIDGDRATMSGRIAIARKDADLGMQSDPDAEYVSEDINVDIRVVATRAP